MWAFGKKVGRLKATRLVRFCLVVDWDCTLDCTWVYVFKRIETAPKEIVERWERKFLPPVFFFGVSRTGEGKASQWNNYQIARIPAWSFLSTFGTLLPLP